MLEHEEVTKDGFDEENARAEAKVSRDRLNVVIALVVGIGIVSIGIAAMLWTKSDPVTPTVEATASSSEEQLEYKQSFDEAQKAYEMLRQQVNSLEKLKGSEVIQTKMETDEAEASSLADENRYKDGLDVLEQLNKFLENKVQQSAYVKNFDQALKTYQQLKPQVNAFDNLKNNEEVQTKMEEGEAKVGSLGSMHHYKDGFDILEQLNEFLENKVQNEELKLKNQLIEKLFIALEANNLAEAALVLGTIKKNKKAVPKSEYAHLESEYRQKQYNNDFAMVIKKLDELIAKDLWVEARKLIATYQKSFESESSFKIRSDTVQRINAHAQNIAKAIANPDDLLSSRVRKSIDLLLKGAEPDLKFSPTLKKQADQLKNLLAQYRLKVPVTVVSDGKTYIEVKSVGKVGATTSKTIQLLPGKYIFVGKKPGHVSRQVKVFVKPNTPTEVKVVANERI